MHGQGLYSCGIFNDDLSVIGDQGQQAGHDVFLRDNGGA